MQYKEKNIQKFVSMNWESFECYVINFWIFKIITNELSVTDCFDNFLNNTTKLKKGELR